MAATATRGRKAAPAKLRLLQGRAEGQDSGGREVEPEIKFDRAAPAKPGHLSPDAAWLWDRIVEQMTSVGLLKPLDAAALEVACENFARWREAVRYRREHGLLGKNSQGVVVAQWITIEVAASREFRAWCAEFGLTPAAEKNLTGEAGEGGNGSGKENPFD